MTAHNLHSVLQLISQAYPEKPLDPLTLAFYLDELADIPVRLLEQAAREHIRTSAFFPRIAELRQAAQKISGPQGLATLAPPGYDFLYAEYLQFIHAHCHQGVFDPQSWEQLARKLDRLGRDNFARGLQEKARFI